MRRALVALALAAVAASLATAPVVADAQPTNTIGGPLVTTTGTTTTVGGGPAPRDPNALSLPPSLDRIRTVWSRTGSAPPGNDSAISPEGGSEPFGSRTAAPPTEMSTSSPGISPHEQSRTVHSLKNFAPQFQRL